MNATAMPSNSSAISSSGVITSVANSTLAAANGTLAGPHGPSETTLHKSAQTTRLLLGCILLEFVLLWLLCVVLVVHVRYKRAAAFKGDDSAARKIILPAFEPLLVVLGVFNCAFMLVMGIAMESGTFDKTVSSVVLETNYSGGQFGFVLILVFMLQKSVSIPALRRAVAIAFVLSGYTIPYVWYVTTYGDPTKQLSYVKGLHGLRALVLLLSVYVFIWPPSRASKRTLRELAVYSIIRYFLALLYMIMVTSPNPATRAESKYALYTTLFWIVFIPLVIWRVLKADTEYWRGMGQRAVALQGLFKQQNHIHEGVSSEGLHVFIEMHRKYIIDFAYLDIKQQIGVGSTSTVFRGALRSKYRVAVKVYQPNSFTEDVIAGFSHEAALCRLLHHPNIVKFFGMCVSPPTICLVFELCQGSLQDVLQVHSRRQYGPARQQLIINVGYMLDAARAVAYLHSFSPPFVHRDIKPSNFLVDAECNVKLSDFGESRTLTQLKAAQARQQKRKQSKQARRNSKDTDRDSKGSTGTWSALDHKESPYAETFHETNGSPLSPTATSYRNAHISTEMTVKGTADYMAPEVIRGKGGVACYDQAADVYSLAITMWDILNPGLDKFGPSNQSHLYVFESVLSGTRPVLDPSLPRALCDVIQSAWQDNSQLRPSAGAVVSVLEDVQETLCAPFVVDVMDELQICVDHPEESGSHTAPGNFTGASAADVLLDHNYVSSLIEAARMGNAWMDAGLLHHAKHTRAFENSVASLYFFDVDNNAKLRQAIDTTRQSEPSGNSIPMLAPATLSQHLNGASTRRSQRLSRGLNIGHAVGLHAVDSCACQKLGQRATEEHTARDKFRRKQFARRPAADDLVLTTALLMNDDDDLDAFVGHGDSVTDSRGG